MERNKLSQGWIYTFFVAIIVLLAGVQLFINYYPYPHIIAEHGRSHSMWWNLAAWALIAAILGAFFRRPLPPAVMASISAGVMLGGIWLVNRIPLLNLPHDPIYIFFLIAASLALFSSILLYYMLFNGTATLNFRVGLTAVFALTVLAGQALIIFNSFSLIKAAPETVFDGSFKISWRAQMPGPPPAGDLKINYSGGLVDIAWGTQNFSINAGTGEILRNSQEQIKEAYAIKPKQLKQINLSQGSTTSSVHLFPMFADDLFWLGGGPESRTYYYARPVFKTRGIVVAAGQVWGEPDTLCLIIFSYEADTNTVYVYGLKSSPVSRRL